MVFRQNYSHLRKESIGLEMRALFAVVACVFMLFPSGVSAGNADSCTSTREFVTTLEYLRAHKEFELPEKEARSIADRVSLGCTGAALRFVRVANLLTRSGLSSKNALEVALEFARKDSAQTETFIEVFRRAFLAEYLDMDMQSSVRIARSLSSEFRGDSESARRDFIEIVRFCVEAEGLDLPRPECGKIAARVAKLGEGQSAGVARGFIRIYDFVRSARGPGRPSFEALRVAEEVMATGESADANFIQAYEYAVSQNGLGLVDLEAVTFAKRMANRSIASVKTEATK